MAMTKVKNLQMWCKKMTDGYRDVEVRDMAASWKSGLAFCAIIHRFRPDLIDYDSLSKENVFENNNLAFEVAEKQLNIPAFLEAEDMVAIRVPDKLSVVTYVSQYYNYFHNKPQLGGPGLNMYEGGKKPVIAGTPDSKSLTPATTNADNTAMKKGRQDTMSDKCGMCKEKVYLLERHIEGGKLYHRSCFRNSELSPTSKVFKKHPLSPAAERKDPMNSKHRRLDNETEAGKSEEKLDFWQRRNQAKNKDKPAVDTSYKTDVEMKSANSGLDKNKESVSDVPSWKKGLDKHPDNKPRAASGASMFGTNNHKDVEKPKAVSTGLADKFKQLNDRNLQHLNDDAKGITKDSKTDKATVFNHKPKENAKRDTSPSHPKAKPRHHIASKFEKMDTSEQGTVHQPEPKPVPRFQKKSDNLSPKASPRHLDNKSKSPPTTRSNGFARPKTPPQRPKSEFSLNLNPVAKDNKRNIDIESPSSPPPPLPCSTPPRIPVSHPAQKLPASHPPKFDLDLGSPKSSPRGMKSEPKAEISSHKKFSPEPKPRNIPHKSQHFGDTKSKNIAEESKMTANLIPPSKPPRASALIEPDRSPSPMETSDIQPPAKAVVKGPYGGHAAVLVNPNRPSDEQKEKETFGGLLKSLAVVRNKHDSKTPTTAEDSSKGAGSSSITKPSAIKSEPKVTDSEKTHRFTKVTDTKHEEKNKVPVKQPPRPKSAFVAQSANFIEPHKEEVKPGVKVINTTKTTTTTTVTTTHDKKGEKHDVDKKTDVTVVTRFEEDDMPEWKKKLEERKKEKARPKSADILNDRNKDEGLLDWQKEAAKRKELRKGGYDDPEKPKVKGTSAIETNKPDVNLNQNNVTEVRRALSPVGKRDEKITKPEPVKLDTSNKSKAGDRKKISANGSVFYDNGTEKTTFETQKKKITVDTKFRFDEIEEVKPVPYRPARPSQPPGSPTPPGVPAKSTKTHPARPPPPRAVSNYQPTKSHIPAYKIQRQLQLIDQKLTQLELKGRTLEDSIRNGKEEEEDDLMISWFQLVNEKNELVRRECDFIYINRQQELEVQQHEIDQQLRDLVDKPSAEKSSTDVREEEYLMEKLLDLVNQRSKIVDTIDEDRIRYLQEDAEIEAMLAQKGLSKGSKDKHKKKEQTVS